MTLEERIEEARSFFELADNWPIEPFQLPGGGWVFAPAQFIDGHLEMVLSGKNAALLLPYLERLEWVAVAVKMKEIPCVEHSLTCK